jgi:CubicO group peptidase (beta-lactamase class C family)
MEPFEAYHRRTAQQHQEAVDRLSGQGFRMIALSVYGAPSDARYNAVWVRRAGGGWLAFHGVRDADYQTRFNEAVASGRAPVLVSATGTGSSAVFGAAFEAGAPGPWMARHGLDRAGFEAANNQAVQGGMALRSMTVYGASASPRYAAVWHARAAGVLTHLRALENAGDYQAVFDAESSLPFFRPRCVSVAEDHRLAAVFSNDNVGQWVARHGLTASAYQREFDSNVAAGLVPICIDAGGVGSGARFAAIFAERDISHERRWSATGRRPAALAATEAIVESFMKRHSIRSAQLSIARNLSVPFERAYTWSEPGTRRTGVRDRMLLASNSKIFVTAAVQTLYDQITRRGTRVLRPTRRVYPLLGFSGPMDARSDQITIQHLMDHRGGYTNTPTDATYDMRQIARDLGLSRPPTPIEIARRIYTTRNLTNAPGTIYSYSNFSYLVGMAVVERISGLSFMNFVRQRLLAPLGVTDVAPCPTAGPGGRPADQVQPEDDGLGLTTLRPATSAMVPAVYGGDGMAKESTLGSCGLAASATALVRVIGRHAVWGMGGRMNGRRDGSTPGCRSTANSRPDGVDWAFIANTRVGLDDGSWNGLIDQINASLDDWPAARLRPRVMNAAKKKRKGAAKRR